MQTEAHVRLLCARAEHFLLSNECEVAPRDRDYLAGIVAALYWVLMPPASGPYPTETEKFPWPKQAA